MTIPLLLILIQLCSSYLLCNGTKIRLGTESIGGLIVDAGEKLKVEFTSKKPFHLTLYTHNGIPLQYRNTHVSYTGKPTYYQISNLDNECPIKVLFKIYRIEPNWLIIIFQLLTICAIIALVHYRRDHRISQMLLFSLLAIKIYESSDYDKIAERIFHKILF